MSTSSRNPFHGRPGSDRRSMALLIVLSILALISVLVLSFFARAAMNRNISFASAGQARADNVSETALQTILGDLREEIRAGSSQVPGTAGGPIYVPSTNLNMVPQRLGSAGMADLCKESVGASNLWPGPSSQYQFAGPVRSLAGNSTTNAGADGRYIPLTFWQRPQLITAAELPSLRPPDWVPVTRMGALTNAPAIGFAALTNSAATTFAVGRYAYTVYNIGGLLDANVAGYHSQSGLTASDLARGGSLSLACITNIGGLTQAQVDALVTWRNPAAYNSYSNYAFHVANTNGFLYPSPGNQGFVSRQDLINYAASNGITPALPYLTAFSREKNSPSWSPTTPSGSTIAYAAQAETAGSTNRDFANLRATDGTALIKSRFDLDRLAWLTWEGPSADLPTSNPLYDANGTDANIRKYFGLTWDTTPFSQVTEHGQQWAYTSPDGGGVTPSAIKTLDQVSGRQPDFFELMKGAILSGSLALYSAGELGSAMAPVGAGGLGSDLNSLNYRANAVGNSSANSLFNQVADYQICAIGANIINQYSTALYPVFIQTRGGNVTGITSMPYVLGWGVDVYRPTTNCPAFSTAPPNPYRTTVGFWLDFVVWNPHRNAAVASTAPQPTAFRVSLAKGIVSPCIWGYTASAPLVRDFSTEPVSLGFANSTAYVDPTLLTAAQVTGYSDANYPNRGLFNDLNGKSISGLFLGSQTVEDTNVLEAKADPAPIPGGPWTNPLVKGPEAPTTPTVPMDLRVQYQLPNGGGWRSYQMANNTFVYRPTPGAAPYTNAAPIPGVGYAYGDPRDRRLAPSSALGMGITGTGVASTYRNDASTWGYGATYMNSGPLFHFSPGFGNYGTPREFPACYADNVAASTANGPENTYYQDPDGVVRAGDANNTGQIPAALNATAGLSRPLILNQPFRSVADLGYAFRDLPWKTLDFFSTNSADAGLLDLFGFYGGGAGDLPVVAGKIDLNAAPAPVLQALLTGAAVEYAADLQTVGTTLSSSDVTTLMNALRPASGAAPAFVNKADLVAFFATNMPAAYQVKAQREAPVRALANVVQTRTWNLLIDVVAQAGRYPPGATGPDQFLVEGEKHYWLQVAIDRFTGEIVDQQLESVYEQ